MLPNSVLSLGPRGRNAVTLSLFALCGLFGISLAATRATVMSAESGARARMAAMPLVFEQNVGQAGGEVQFLARGQGYTLGLNGSETLLSLREQSPKSKVQSPKSTLPDPQSAIRNPRSAMLKMRLVGANPKAKAVGEKRLKAKINYFIGNDRSKWKTDVPAFEAVRTKDVYPGIDLVHYGQATGALEYDLVVAPGVDPGQIRLAFDGAESVRVDENGDLLIRTAAGEVRQQKPVCYQERNGGREPVEGQLVRIAKTGRFCFKLGDYDSAAPLIIDPVLSYSTYLGGSSGAEARGVATDDEGRAFVVGETGSSNFPTFGAYQTDQTSSDVFVTVLDTRASGSASLLYSTYLGGGSFEQAWGGIATDGAGRAYVAGWTNSTNFPTLGAYQTDQPDWDTFVTVLDTTATGSASLVYSTYLGGGFGDFARGIAADNEGRAFVTGETSSTNFPTLGAYQTDQPSDDAFISVLDTTAAGNDSLVYSTYLGGDSGDYGYGIATDGLGRAYVAGQAGSSNFPILGEYQTDQPSADAFVTVLDTTATGSASLVYSTYLGGGQFELAWAIAADASGRAFVTGYTESSNFPTFGQYQTDQTATDAFVTVVDSTLTGGASLLYSTYLGGGSHDEPHGITTDGAGRVFVAGLTSSTNYPIFNQFLSDQTAQDAFLTVMDTNQSGIDSLLYSTYLGGNGSDAAHGIATDGSGRVLVAGGTGSTNFPTAGQYQSDQPSFDAFVSVFDLAPVAPSGLTASPGSSSSTVNLAWTDNSTDETGFEIERKEGMGVFASIGTVGAGVTSAVDTMLTPETTYTYRVRATGTLYPSDYSNEDDATTIALPNAPSDASAVPTSSTRIVVTWQDNSTDEGRFKIERKAGMGAWGSVGKVNANVTTFIDNTATPGVEYRYRVRAYRDTDWSLYSNEAQVVALPTLVAPANLTGTPNSQSRIQLTWTDDNPDEHGTRIERKSGMGAFAQVATVEGGVTSYGDKNLLPATTYTYRVRAYRGSEVSPYSSEAEASTLAVPAAPADVAATPTSRTRIVVTWTDTNGDESGYKIERKSGMGAFASVGKVGAGVTSFANGGLMPNTTYTYRVRAFRGSDYSAWSSEAEGTTLP